MVSRHRRTLCFILAAASVAIAPAAVAQTQPYPQRPIQLVVGYPPGSTSDIMARKMGQSIATREGWNVVVENRPGASGNTGTAAVARANPDGYTILFATDNPITTNQHLFSNLGFDPKKDLRPITIAASNIIVLAAATNLPVNSVPELLALARQKPGTLAFGTSGVGSPHHLAGELLKARAKIDIRHVPYKGGGPALVDLAGGHLPLSFVSLSGALPLVKQGRIKLLAITEEARYSAIPNVPTLAETVPGVSISSWVGFFAPAGVPTPIINRLNAAVVASLKDETLREELLAIGLVPVGNTPQAAEAQVEKDTALRGELVRISGATAE